MYIVAHTHEFYSDRVLIICGCDLVAKSCLTLATPWTVAHQALLSVGFPRQGYWSGLPLPSAGDLPDTGIEPWFSALQMGSLPFESPGKPIHHILVWYVFMYKNIPYQYMMSTLNRIHIYVCVCICVYIYIYIHISICIWIIFLFRLFLFGSQLPTLFKES